MKYAYYPGCSLHSSGIEFGMSLNAICPKLNVQLEEVKGWVCCGSTPAHSVSELLAIALPVANLCLVEDMAMKEVVVPCASCFRRLKSGHVETTTDSELRAKIDQVVDKPYKGTVTVRHPLEIFSDEKILPEIAKLSTEDLSQLKVACYYGCLLTRPPEIMQFDQYEYPMSMDAVLRAAGISTLDWDFKTMCCGAAFSLTEEEIVYKLTGDILEEAQKVGANAIAVACPMCHSNLDMRQPEIEAKLGKKYGIPIFYFTQLMGLAMGVPGEELGLSKHFVDAQAIIGNGKKEAVAVSAGEAKSTES
jgi:heterodisulfide reductase subunit B